MLLKSSLQSRFGIRTPKTLTMRGKEIFERFSKSVKEHGGYVSYSYYHGLWYYRLQYGSWTGGATLRRLLPRAYQVARAVPFLRPAFSHQAKR